MQLGNPGMSLSKVTTTFRTPRDSSVFWGKRHLSQLPTYVKTPVEVSDQQLLAEHPLVKTWETVFPYLVKWHPEYSRVTHLYNDML